MTVHSGSRDTRRSCGRDKLYATAGREKRDDVDIDTVVSCRGPSLSRGWVVVTLYATLVPVPDRPTSHARVGRTKLGGRLQKGDTLAVRFDDEEVFLRAAPVDDQLADGIGDELRVSASLADRLLPPPEAGEVRVERVDGGVVPVADRVVLDPHGNDPAELASLLRERAALLHPGTERYDIDERAGATGVVSFTVTERQPTVSTVRVDDTTRIEFVDGSESGEVAQLRAAVTEAESRLDEIERAVDDVRGVLAEVRAGLDTAENEGDAGDDTDD